MELLYLLDYNEYNQKTLEAIQLCVINTSKHPMYPNKYDHYFYMIIMLINPKILKKYA